MIDSLRKAGLSADIAYAGAAASVGLSIAIWLLSKGDDKGHAERFGIFVGLWAPTLVGIGNALAAREEPELLDRVRDAVA
jgi:hypothetical protein